MSSQERIDLFVAAALTGLAPSFESYPLDKKRTKENALELGRKATLLGLAAMHELLKAGLVTEPC